MRTFLSGKVLCLLSSLHEKSTGNLYFFVCIGSMSIPFFETSGSVHWLRLKQHGLRSPALSFDNATSIRRLRVSRLLVARIQRSQSQRAIVVSFTHKAFACGSDASALFKSVGTSGSGHALDGSTAIVTVLRASISAALCKPESTLNQWLPLPSGSSTILERKPLIVPSTKVIPRDGSFALAFSGSLRMVQSPILRGVVSKRIVGISPLFSSSLSSRARRSFSRRRRSTSSARKRRATSRPHRCSPCLGSRVSRTYS